MVAPSPALSEDLIFIRFTSLREDRARCRPLLSPCLVWTRKPDNGTMPPVGSPEIGDGSDHWSRQEWRGPRPTPQLLNGLLGLPPELARQDVQLDRRPRLRRLGEVRPGHVAGFTTPPYVASDTSRYREPNLPERSSDERRPRFRVTRSARWPELS